MARVVDEGDREDRSEPPEVRVRERGQMNQIMDDPVELLREQNPDKDYRYVYAPPQGSQYSQVNIRAAQGYRVVDLEEEDLEVPSAGVGESDSKHQVADVVLMEIPKERKRAREKELQRRAQEDADRAEEAYYQNVRRETEGHARPTGSVTTEQESYNVSPEEG